MQTLIYQLGVLTLIIAVSLYLTFKQNRRSPEDVIDDLFDEDNAPQAKPVNQSRFLQDDLTSAGLFDQEEKDDFKLKLKIIPVTFLITAGLVSFLLTNPSLQKTIIFSFGGLSIGYLYSQSLLRKAKAKFISEIVFYLPVVMERIVMAVQSGLDILPALKAVSELDQRTRTETKMVFSLEKADPVSRLLGLVVKLSDSGLGFEQALNDVASLVESSPLKHAFIHLGVAQREGGELIMPLKELSDSTQLYFQESVEEEIAKLPVKATMPLLCTFAGLIVCFITTPLVQIVELTTKTTLTNF
ncbi:MAG: hypothetical protein R3A13_06200 [Bdellovibrionota bacterium]